jgi:hypothetical protein
MWRCLVLMLLSAWGCAPPKPIPGVVRPRPGEPMLEKLPGPMPGFGPFDSYSAALCDGFFEYIPATGEVTKWTPAPGKWDWERMGSVEWLNETDYVFHPQ